MASSASKPIDARVTNVLILSNITGINNIILKLCLKLPPTVFGTVEATSRRVNQSCPTLPVYCVIGVAWILLRFSAYISMTEDKLINGNSA